MNRNNRKEKKKEREEREYNLKLKQLQTLYNNWLDTYVYGPSDGFNADEKLNWLRKQIIETKSRLTELYTKRKEQVSFLPEGHEIKPQRSCAGQSRPKLNLDSRHTLNGCDISHRKC